MFRKLLSIEETRRVIEQNLSQKPIGIEKVHLSDMYNRILAEDVVATLNVPPFNRSTVDGYAVIATDTFGADEDQPITLKVDGNIKVGKVPELTVERGSAAEIVTGAPLPRGADTIVMMEHTIRKGDQVLIYNATSKMENVMKAGSDIQKGSTLLKKGQLLSAHEIGILASLGLVEAMVYRQPKVAIISTGQEIIEPGKPLPPGKIYDINAHSLNAAVQECGGDPTILGIIPDKTNQLINRLREALTCSDLVITSGGVSVGPTDVTPKVLSMLGKPGVIASGIASKPGKPTTIAIIGVKPVFSLPGHPTSAMIMFHVLVRPVIQKMAGRNDKKLFKVKAIFISKMFSARGRRTFIMVNIARDESGRLLASPVPPGLSGAITTIAHSDGYIELSEKQQFVDSGEVVTVHLFKPVTYKLLKE